MKYLNKTFKNLAELKSWTKAGNIEHYKKLAKMFSKNPTMELNVIMCDCADVLIKHFGLTPNEIEAIEIEAVA